MADNEKKTAERTLMGLSEGRFRIPCADDLEDQEKKKGEADQAKPPVPVQRARLSSISRLSAEDIKSDLNREAGTSDPSGDAMKTALQGRLGAEADTGDSSQVTRLAYRRLLPDKDSPLPGISRMNTAIPSASAVATREEQTKKLTEELSSHLTDDFNFELYRSISAKEPETMFPREACRFFKELYDQYNYVKENKTNPTLVLSKIRQLGRNYLSQPNYLSNNDPAAKQEWEKNSKTRFHRLLSSLAMLIRHEHESEADGEIQDRDLSRCLILIEDELESRLDSNTRAQVMTEVRSVVLKRKFDFAKIKRQIKGLPDTKAKLQYLIEILSEYNQQELIDEDISQGFGRKCQVEIEMLEEKMALERPIESQNEPQAESEAVLRSPEQTLARKILAMNFLLDYAQIGKNVDRTVLEPISKLIFDKMLYERGLRSCPYSIRHIIRMCLLGNYLIASGSESIRCCPSPSLACVAVAKSAGT